MKLAFENVRPEITGDKAVLRCRSTTKMPQYAVTVDEIYLLRKVDGAWKVHENRWWPIQMRFGDEVTRYDAEMWKKLDAEVKRHEEGNDIARQAGALFDAFRFSEAHTTARKWTEQAKKKTDAWLLRGSAAMQASNAEGALASFQKALALDPKADVPDYVRAAKQAPRRKTHSWCSLPLHSCEVDHANRAADGGFARSG